MKAEKDRYPLIRSYSLLGIMTFALIILRDLPTIKIKTGKNKTEIAFEAFKGRAIL